jgi:hypothetical protein
MIFLVVLQDRHKFAVTIIENDFLKPDGTGRQVSMSEASISSAGTAKSGGYQAVSTYRC